MASKATVTPGQAVVETLQNEGVEYVFSVVAFSFLGLLDALYGREDVKYIGVRHEQAAAFMADGYARISGKPGVCVGTSGPGATNLMTGVAAAYLGHSPVIAIGGAAPLQDQHRDAVQELDQVSMFRPVTKLALSINKAERVPELLRHGIRVAMSGRRGPVYLDIPRDVFEDQPIQAAFLDPKGYRDTVGGQRADEGLIQQAAALLLSAERPVILSGGGVIASNGTPELVQLADLLGLPLVASYGRQDGIPNTHPLYQGALGRSGAPEAGETVHRADLILAVGTRLAQFTSWWDNRIITPHARIIHIEIDPKEIGRIYPVALGIVGDARAVTAQLLAEVQRRKPPQPLNPAWTTEALQRSKARWQRLEGDGRLDSLPIKPQRVYYEMRKVLPKDAIMVMDAGAAGASGYDRLVFHQSRSLVAPLDLGCLGFAYPEALGAKLAAPHRPVVAIHGDGGFLFNAQELETAVRERIPVVCVVMNNNSWGSEKAFQRDLYHGRYVGSDITNPRFDKMAELFGARGFYAERPADVATALEEALRLSVPSVIEIPIDPEELPTPIRLAPQQAG